MISSFYEYSLVVPCHHKPQDHGIIDGECVHEHVTPFYHIVITHRNHDALKMLQADPAYEGNACIIKRAIFVGSWEDIEKIPTLHAQEETL